MNIKRLTPTCTEINIEWKSGQRQSLMVSADHHWDNPKTNLELLSRDLQRAIDEDMPILSLGDLFCAMQGRGDRRGSKSDIRPEHKVGNYLDALSDTAAEWYAPYAQNIAVLADGNHESAVLKNKEVDLGRRLAEGLYHKTGHRPIKMPYAGWVFIRFRINGVVMNTVKIAYTHGHGGGGIVTKGTLWPLRRAAQYPDADIFLSGHIHEQWVFPIMQEKITTRGVSYITEQLHMQLATYKEEYLQKKGFHAEKGGPPKPLGCWYLHFDMGEFKNPETGRAKKGVRIDYETSVKKTMF